MAKESMKARQAKRERLVAKYAAKRAQLKKDGATRMCMSTKGPIWQTPPWFPTLGTTANNKG